VGPEPVILGIWIIQAIAAVALAFRSAYFHQWLAAVGAACGVAIGFAPLFFLNGPAVWEPYFFIGLTSVVALVIFYGFAKRWKRFTATFLMLVIMVVSIPGVQRLLSAVPTVLGFIGEIAILFSPLICAITLLELAGSLDRFPSVRRSV